MRQKTWKLVLIESHSQYNREVDFDAMTPLIPRIGEFVRMRNIEGKVTNVIWNFTQAEVLVYLKSDNDDDADDDNDDFNLESDDDFDNNNEPESNVEILDELLDEAERIVVLSGQTTPDILQKKLMIGHNRSLKLMELLEKKGIVGPLLDNQSRQLLIDKKKYIKDKEVDTNF